MPAVSEDQRKAAGVALAAKRGKMDVSKLKGASKEMYDSMSEKELEDFATKSEETVLDNNVLTESQRKELKSIIDTLVEERVTQKQKDFVKKYTKFIVESATVKVVEKMKNGVLHKVNEEIDTLKNKSQKLCKMVLMEASAKVQEKSKAHRKLLKSFKESAPKMIKEMANKKAQEMAEEAKSALEENDRLNEAFVNFTNALSKAGYVINEDVDQMISKVNNEKKMLRTKLVEAQRDLKLAQLTEGMLPAQKKKTISLLEDCVTARQIEDRFLTVKEQILTEERTVDDEEGNKSDNQLSELAELQEEENYFEHFLGESRKFIEKNA